jgi:hypothetical protein
VEVKGMEWSTGWGSIKAETPIGHYFIDDNRDGGFKVRLEDTWSSWASNSEAAKAAAQADYERRIRSCLSVEPAGVEPVGEAGAMPGSNGGFTMAAFEASKVPVGTKLYASPPKAVTITDEMVERAAEAIVRNHSPRWEHLTEISRDLWRKDARAALTAALSIEAHNGREGE